MLQDDVCKNQKVNQLVNLFTCAFVDGSFDESEKKFLLEIAKRLKVEQISIDNLYELQKNISDNFSITQNLDEEEKIQHIIDLVFMMMIDCQICEKQLEFCKNVAKQTGYESKIVDLLISRILKEIKVEVHTEN